MDVTTGREAPRFLADAMLGRLARWLRAMGYDALYSGPSPGWAGDRRLLQLARVESRILVTRDRILSRLAEPHACFVRSERVDDQILEIMEQLGLTPEDEAWLSRCLQCNAPLEARSRQVLRGLVPEHVLATHAEFKGCPDCRRIYWGGTHVDRMRARLTAVLARRASPPSRRSAVPARRVGD